MTTPYRYVDAAAVTQKLDALIQKTLTAMQQSEAGVREELAALTK